MMWFFALLSSVAFATPPPGFVDLKEAAPGVLFDVRYAGIDNFTEAPLPGYCAPRAWMLRGAAAALAKVQKEVETHRVSLLVYDAYRPARGTAAMVRWTQETQQSQLLDQGYIARRSGHNQGATVDLTLVKAETGRVLNMGTPFDQFSERSHTANATGEALQNRMRLKGVMEKHGFRNYDKEWWHYTWTGAPAGLPYLDVPYPCVQVDDVTYTASFKHGVVRRLKDPAVPRGGHSRGIIGGQIDADSRAEIVVASGYGGEQGQHPGTVTIEWGRGGGKTVIKGPAPADAFGQTATFAGDWDQDGRLDLLVGAPGFQDDPEEFSRMGRAYLFASGSLMPGKPVTVADAVAEFVPGMSVGSVGSGVFAAGDLDGDGRPEVAIHGGDSELYIFKGSQFGYSREMAVTGAHWTLHYPGAESWLVAALGDLDGDGKGELLVAEAAVDDLRGAVWIVQGSTFAAKRRIEMAVDATAIAHEDRSGWSVATGDFDGDKAVDAALLYAEGESETSLEIRLGRVRMNGVPQLSTARFTAPENHRLDHLVNAGDLDGDGRDDLLVGTTDIDWGEMRLFVVLGSVIAAGKPVSLDDVPHLSFDVERIGDLGSPMIRASAVGDVNGDGRNDIGVTFTMYPYGHDRTVQRMDRTWVFGSPFEF